MTKNKIMKRIKYSEVLKFNLASSKIENIKIKTLIKK